MVILVRERGGGGSAGGRLEGDGGVEEVEIRGFRSKKKRKVLLRVEVEGCDVCESWERGNN